MDSLVIAGALAGAVKFFKDKFDLIYPDWLKLVQLGHFMARQSFNLT